MDLSEFFRLRKLGQKIRRTQIKLCTEDLFKLSDIWLLGGYPSHKIQRKAKQVLKHRFPQKFHHLVVKNWNQYIPSNLYPQWMQFQILFLLDSSFTLYYKTYQKIVKNKALFHPYLIEGLIHTEETVQLNCANILSTLYPELYPVPSSGAILAELSEIQKTELNDQLENRFTTQPNLPWYSKEDIIVKLGALQNPKAVEIMEEMIGDSDEGVRMQLAHTLKRIRSEKGIHLLYLLLLDQSADIREEAAKSLGFLVPGLYAKKTYKDILESLSSSELLEIVSKTGSRINLDHIWRKHHLHPETLQKFIYATETNEEELLSEYLQFLQHQEGEAQIQSLLLVIFARGHTFLHYLDHILQSGKYHTSKPVLLDLQSKMQQNFSIKKKNGLNILL